MNMKRLFSIMILFAAMGAASAQSYSYLTLKGTDGSEESFSLSKIKLTFQNSQMTIANADGDRTFKLENINLMRFDATPTGIQTVELSDGYRSEGPDAVYTIDGRRLQGASPNNLPRGLYIVRQNDHSKKIYVR